MHSNVEIEHRLKTIIRIDSVELKKLTLTALSANSKSKRMDERNYLSKHVKTVYVCKMFACMRCKGDITF